MESLDFDVCVPQVGAGCTLQEASRIIGTVYLFVFAPARSQR